MNDPVYDFNSGEVLFTLDNKLAVDLEGKMKLRVADNMSMDTESGSLHFTSPWEKPFDENGN